MVEAKRVTAATTLPTAFVTYSISSTQFDNHSKGVLPKCCTSTLRILPAKNDSPEVLKPKRNPGVMVMRSLTAESNTSKEQIRTQLLFLSNSPSTRRRLYASVMLAPEWQIIADLKLNSFICSDEVSQTNSTLVKKISAAWICTSSQFMMDQYPKPCGWSTWGSSSMSHEVKLSVS